MENYVTWNDIVQIATLVVGIITLVFSIHNKK